MKPAGKDEGSEREPDTVDLPSRTPEWPAMRAVLSAPLMEPPPGFIEEQLSEAEGEARLRGRKTDPVVPKRSFPLVYALSAIDMIVNGKFPVKAQEEEQPQKEEQQPTEEADGDTESKTEADNPSTTPPTPKVPVVDKWRTLVYVVDELLSEEEAAQLMKGMFALALDLERLFPTGTVPRLVAGRNGLVALSRAQVACVLAHAFFGTFCAVQDAWDFNLLSLAAAVPGADGAGSGIYHGVLRYFLHVLGASAAGTPLTGTVRIARAVLPGADSAAAVRAADTHVKSLRAQPLCAVTIDDAARIEDVGGGALHADFANRRLGGGVLGGGCVQEEIRFGLASPELLAGLLVARAPMADHEAVVLCGTERVSCYRGYGRRVAWAGPAHDATPRAPDGSLASAVVAVDALPVPGAPEAQFARAWLARDLAKACAGFSFAYAPDHPLAGLAARDVATGKWGCGVFGGDPELKFLLQWLAVSAGAPGRTLVFCTFADTTGLPQHLRAVVDACRAWPVARLHERVCAYADARVRAARDHQRRLDRCCATNARRLADHRAACAEAERNGTPAPPAPDLIPTPPAPDLNFLTFIQEKPSSCFTS